MFHAKLNIYFIIFYSSKVYEGSISKYKTKKLNEEYNKGKLKFLFLKKLKTFNFCPYNFRD